MTWVRTPRQAVTGPSVNEYNIMSDNDLSTTKVPVFNGKQSEFPVWWRRFKAYAKIKKFSKCLKSTAETDLPDSETEAAADTNAEKEARKRNELAVLYFTMAFKADALMDIIMQSETPEYTEGLAWKIVAELEHRFKPTDHISEVEMKTQLLNISMKKKDAPRVLFDQIAKI